MFSYSMQPGSPQWGKGQTLGETAKLKLVSQSSEQSSGLGRGKGTTLTQCAKKIVSNSLGLVDFAIGLVNFVLNLPNGQVLCFGEIQITEGL